MPLRSTVLDLRILSYLITDCAAYHCMPEQVLESAVKMRNFLNFRHAPKETSEVRKLEMQILKEEKEKRKRKPLFVSGAHYVIA